jgi:hypothetical protein
MSTYQYQRPITRLRCDRAGCDAEYQAEYPFDQRDGHRTRIEAGDEGWDVPPIRGEGSRRDTDFCPEHAGGAA